MFNKNVTKTLFIVDLNLSIKFRKENGSKSCIDISSIYIIIYVVQSLLARDRSGTKSPLYDKRHDS